MIQDKERMIKELAELFGIPESDVSVSDNMDYVEDYETGEIIGDSYDVKLEGETVNVSVFNDKNADEMVVSETLRLIDDIGYQEFADAIKRSGLDIADYIDYERLARDSINIAPEGRGNYLNGYDGTEYVIDGDTFAYLH